MNRREFLRFVGAGTIASTLSTQLLAKTFLTEQDRPNFLWVSIEDMGPLMGCYGDKYARTPNIDKLSSEGVRYTNCFAVCSVCSPSRSSIITGMYASSLGSQHQRSMVQAPEFIKFFPYYLRQAGYFCTNNAKCDYNMPLPTDVWDQNGSTAHWRNRKKGQPFFSVFNLEECHSGIFFVSDEKERKTRLNLVSPEEIHDPAKAPLPPQYPDKPIYRQRIAQMYDSVTQVDHHVNELMASLEQDGLLDNTIVFFWADGGTGWWHGKTLIYDEGVHVPLIIRFPKRYQHFASGKPGSTKDSIVTLMDLGPSLLSLAGLPTPRYMQGEAFLGESATKERSNAIAIRDRFGFSHDLSRSVREHRYRYIRNFYPHIPYGWWYGYVGSGNDDFYPPSPKEKPDIIAWQDTKPMEELYDTVDDPQELNNLANSSSHLNTLNRLRNTLFKWMVSTRDLGLIDELEMQERAGDKSPYDVGKKHDNFQRVLETADMSRLGKKGLIELKHRLTDSDAAVRYWAIVGLAILGASDDKLIEDFKQALKDPSLSVRLAATDALCRLNHNTDAIDILEKALAHSNELARYRAAFIIGSMDKIQRVKIKTILPALKHASDIEKDSFNAMVFKRAMDNMS